MDIIIVFEIGEIFEPLVDFKTVQRRWKKNNSFQINFVQTYDFVRKKNLKNLKRVCGGSFSFLCAKIMSLSFSFSCEWKQKGNEQQAHEKKINEQ